ncbi:MAG: 2-iminoacetate synthase ThiH [Defluviitaleaceae bacterium]|nr:2-iminoacetate synthase ThiH [Defluviitaleaceae bacterium]
MLQQLLDIIGNFNPNQITQTQVLRAIQSNRRSIYDFAALLSPAADLFLEEMATAAKQETARHFGNSVQLFTPLYLANYCTNHCTYCAFAQANEIKRGKLTSKEIERELAAIAATGLDEVLLLTGESRQKSDVSYIRQAVQLAATKFTTVGLEVYPMDTHEYQALHQAGADFVNVYQETYNQETYARVHPKGQKRDYEYRFYSQERALQAGMRGVSLGVLLGLHCFRQDSFAAGVHAYLLQQKYPHAEIAFSVPRLRAHAGQPDANITEVTDRNLLQIMLAYRLFMPFAGITISTREGTHFRDNVVGLCATKISAGVMTGVGGHDQAQKGDDQFQISDNRSVPAVHKMLQSRGLQPVYTNHIF